MVGILKSYQILPIYNVKIDRSQYNKQEEENDSDDTKETNFFCSAVVL